MSGLFSGVICLTSQDVSSLLQTGPNIIEQQRLKLYLRGSRQRDLISNFYILDGAGYLKEYINTFLDLFTLSYSLTCSFNAKDERRAVALLPPGPRINASSISY